MRKTVITLLALGLVMIVAAPCFAVSFWSETFPYPNGDLTTVSGNTWVTHSGTGTDVQVVSGEAVYGSSAPDDNYQFRTQAQCTPDDKIYACFKMKISGTQTSTGTYFAHFMNTATYFCARVFASLVDANTYNLGISSTSSGQVNWPVPLNKDQYYTVAIKYDGTTGISTMWVDPQSEASASVVSAAGPTGTLCSGFALRQSAGYGIATVDNIQVGDSFEDLCPNPTPVSNETWGKLKSLYR